MPLQPPILDDRSYQDLRDELVARIPTFTPEWTDHHASDPGITLVELFAFMGEQLLFRFNQIPDATKLAFLELLHISPEPARAARGLVRFETEAAAGVLVERGSRLLAGDVAFQAESEVRAWPIEGRAAIRAAEDATSLEGLEKEYFNSANAAVGQASKEVSGYRTEFGAHDTTAPGADAIIPAHSIDGSVYVALTGEAPDLRAMAGGLLTIGVAPTDDAPEKEDRAPCPGVFGAPPTPPMQWQISTTEVPPGTDETTVADPIWLDLEVVCDTTGGLTTAGSVRLELPDSLADVGVYVPPDPEATGGGDQPPLVEDETIAERLIAWLRVFRPDGSTLPAIDWLGTNAVMAEQSIAATREFLGTGTGEPDQQLRLVNRNVIGDVEIEVDELSNGRWQRWNDVESFRGSLRDDRDFVLDREAGTITCGDGRRGRTWQIGERVRASTYRHGGGAAGNVSADSMTSAPGVPRVTVSNPLPMRGGADAESLPDAMARIPEEFHRHDRAVTASDFRELAESTPGAGVGRAEALSLFFPKRPDEHVPGAVSVIVWPRHDPKHPTAPVPDVTMLDAVCRHLDARRLITTEVHVIAPEYRGIAVSVGLHVKSGYGIEAVRRWVELILRQYLSPLPPHGPEGRGWPLGRAVFARELEAIALQVEGVDYLDRLRLAERVGDAWSEPGSGRVEIERWQVPELSAISVVDGTARAPGESMGPNITTGPIGSGEPGGSDGTNGVVAVPVRRPKNVC